MSTRSLTHIEEDGKILLTMYRQSDGYPAGHGRDLALFLDGRKLVNGIQDYSAKISNGLPCLAAQPIAKFKSGPGEIYIYPAGTEDAGEQYTYLIRVKGGGFELIGMESDGQKELFRGNPQEVLDAIQKQEDAKLA